ncbi:pH-regulated cell-wall GPI-anchored 1,3-beta-glucanosyltransferase, putative [Candida dubliniensis CD36]|uniref:1,3-beta-glucanosyltransferase n=1 Tax=Candida dubliniensis (strain CD36 / ATCC MYA-646 / CBS 7987 / NCPF 3949 / NRRL Y-17841) TaxID=573826 RepID=B9W722_CANDC|nr:pH-regulated cell-wall GPI-anchored 1,3-beta-glucanosyltransferase, putative [Candida dubliniensis CD36]CAX44480.1 pH-regulated cell-wall GPI-anchored 1,3-beta-glucanosyltransferase, putative [Candida dubliniensis CD36]
MITLSIWLFLITIIFQLVVISSNVTTISETSTTTSTTTTTIVDNEDDIDNSLEEPQIETIKVIGNKFFECESGNQFFIKGIAYQKTRQEGEIYDTNKEPNYIDPLANPFTCLRDLDYLKELGINLVRVYQIHPNANHDICMNAFAKAGIYVLADLSEPTLSIRRDYPHWDTELFNRYKQVIDSMNKYKNLLGFFAGNEVTNCQLNIDASPFVRAAIRDCKNYINQQGYRKIPIGYASNDDANIRKNLANYFICQLDEDEDKNNDNINNINNSQADFFAINVYEWCGYSTYTTSGYRDLTTTFKDYPIPIFFSEFGCNIITPRPFTEVEAIYGNTMNKIWSGGIVYEYFEEINHYGILLTKKDGSITKLPDFDTLKMRFNAVNPIGITIDEATIYEPRISCQDIFGDSSSSSSSSLSSSSSWDVALTLPPTPNEAKCECLWKSLSCVVSDDAIFDEEVALRELCFKVDCEDINANGRSGKYGRYSDCNPTIRTSYALNKYYQQCGKKQEICDFQGRGELFPNRDLEDLGNKFSNDGKNCQSLLEGKEEEEEEGEEVVKPGLPGSNKGKEIGNIPKGKSKGKGKGKLIEEGETEEQEQEEEGKKSKSKSNKTPSGKTPLENPSKTSESIAGGNTIIFKNDSIWKTFIEILFTCSAAILI